MQGPRNAFRELLIIEHVGLEFEHEEQNHPCGRVNAGREPLDDVRQDYSVSKAVRRSSPFHDEEQVDIESKKCVDRIFEKLKDSVAVNIQFWRTRIAGRQRNCASKRALELRYFAI